jgi:hypothetical protein
MGEPPVIPVGVSLFTTGFPMTSIKGEGIMGQSQGEFGSTNITHKT